MFGHYQLFFFHRLIPNLESAIGRPHWKETSSNGCDRICLETLQLLQKECDAVSGAQRLLVSNPEMVRDRDAEMTCSQSRSACWRKDVEGVGLCRWRKAQSTNHVCEAPYCFSTKPLHEGSLLIRHIKFCGVEWIAVAARRSTSRRGWRARLPREDHQRQAHRWQF